VRACARYPFRAETKLSFEQDF